MYCGQRAHNHIMLLYDKSQLCILSAGNDISSHKVGQMIY